MREAQLEGLVGLVSWGGSNPLFRTLLAKDSWPFYRSSLAFRDAPIFDSVANLRHRLDLHCIYGNCLAGKSLKTKAFVRL